MWIQQIQERIGVFVETGGIDDDLIVLGHFHQEFVHAGSFGNVDKMNNVVNLRISGAITALDNVRIHQKGSGVISTDVLELE